MDDGDGFDARAWRTPFAAPGPRAAMPMRIDGGAAAAAPPVPNDGLPAARTDYGKFTVLPGGREAFDIVLGNALTQAEIAAVQPILAQARRGPDSNGELTGAGQRLGVYFNRRAGAAALLADLQNHFGV